jgi:tRNA 2-selenouridine synthase
MTIRPDTDDYLSLFLNDIPMMDVRAPVEFGKGAFPQSANLPLMDDEERRQVGICYKEKGQDAAIRLGHQLVSDDIKSSRITQWTDFVQKHPQGFLYCFRGGLRSRTTQQWIKETGLDYPLIKGGYKAMRRFLIDSLQQLINEVPFVLLGGQTGTGKTRFIEHVDNSLDLEGIANHRGSSFGRRVQPQPSQINFENNLSIALLKAHHLTKKKPILLEDESRLIGLNALPLEFKKAMENSPIIVLEAPLEERIEITLDDYVIQLRQEYESTLGAEQGFEAFKTHLIQSLLRIKKRLGGARTKELELLMEAAFVEQKTSGKLDLHRQWIRHLLVEYYDPMYHYQLEQKKHKVVFSGTKEMIFDWLSCQTNPSPRI